ncbi:MAG TPA: TSUP family transporter [Opitutaceae bacterium]
METLDLSYLEFGSIFLLVAFAGLVDSIAGGGGLITVPTYLAFGLPPGLVLGTNKAVSSTGTLVAVTRYVAHGAINWRLARPAIVMALIGAAGGAWQLRRKPPRAAPGEYSRPSGFLHRPRSAFGQTGLGPAVGWPMRRPPRALTRVGTRTASRVHHGPMVGSRFSGWPRVKLWLWIGLRTFSTSAISS